MSAAIWLFSIVEGTNHFLILCPNDGNVQLLYSEIPQVEQLLGLRELVYSDLKRRNK
jgi:hypothetical protein